MPSVGFPLISKTTMSPNAIHMTSLAPGVNLQAPPKIASSLTPAVDLLDEGSSLPWGSIRSTAPPPGRTTATSAAKAPKPASGKWYRPTWSPINKCIAASGLVIALLAIITTLYFGIVSGPGSPADSRAIWSSHNDFRATCISELESGLPTSPACDKILKQAAEPPPDLEKRDDIIASSYLVQGTVLVFVIVAVMSAFLFTATRFFDSLQLTTVAWEAFDVNDRHELGGIDRTFERPIPTPKRSSNVITRARQLLPSSSHSHEYSLLSARVLMADISSDLTGTVTARIVQWKKLCQQSKMRRLKTIKVPLLPADHDNVAYLQLNSVTSLQQKQEQERGLDLILQPASRIFLPWETEESDASSVYREHLYVLLDSALLERPTKYDLGQAYGPAVAFESPVRYTHASSSGRAAMHAGSSYGYEKRGVYGRNGYKYRKASDEGAVVFGDSDPLALGGYDFGEDFSSELTS
jgi:hypothetical protein